MKLPKHLTATPTIIWADVHLTIDGGDVRQPAVEAVFAAIEEAFERAASEHGLNTCLSRRLRSTDGRRLRPQLRRRGFRVPDPPVSASPEEP
jgi:hypothetical protein